MIHRFPSFEIDEDKREVRVGAHVLQLQPKVFELLAYLAEHNTRVVPKDELLDAVWPGVTVADGSLQRAVSVARAAFAEAGLPDIVRNFPRQGYRLRVESEAGTAPDEAQDSKPGAPSGDGRIS
jgi:DNA-binding winged helix-turn-helix (wHTH) protein